MMGLQSLPARMPAGQLGHPLTTAVLIAGVIATVICFPLDVVRTRLMSSSIAPHYGHGPFRTLAGMLRHEGPAALYAGGVGLTCCCWDFDPAAP